MADGLYIALSGSIATERNLEVLANNLANVATPGFKADRVVFAEYLETAVMRDAPRGAARYVDALATVPDLRAGPLQTTGAPYDVALDGRGYLKVEGADGVARYWRGGALAVRSDGVLATSDGLPVLDRGGGPITLGGARSLEVTEDGRIFAGTGPARHEVGQLALVDVENAHKRFVKAGEGLFAAAPGVSLVETDATAVVRQGVVERGNVNATRAMTDLVAVSRVFEAMQRVMSSWQRADERLIQTVAGR
jgi:flagellar basal body rod protein FlgG